MAFYSLTEINTDIKNINEEIVSPLVTMGADNQEVYDITKKVQFLDPEDEQLQLAEYFKRPYLVKQYSISANSTGVAPSLFQLWWPRVAPKLKGYYYFRGDPVVTVKYTGNPTMTGTFVVYFYPNVSLSTEDYFNPNTIPKVLSSSVRNSYYTQVMQLPHITINLEEYTTKSIKLPFPDIVPCNKIDVNYADWFMDYNRINTPELNSQLTPDAITMDVYVHYENVSLFAPIASEGKEMDDRWLSRGLDYFSRILRGVSTVIPVVSPYQKIVEAASNFAESLGFSRPLEIAEKPVVMQKYNNMSFLSGQPDFSYKIAVDPRVALDITGSGCPLATPLDTDIKHLITTYDLVVTGARSAYEIAAMPQHSPNLTDSTKVYYMPTRLAYVSNAFRYWRGTIKFKVEFVGNALLRQRYCIYKVPPFQTSPTTYALGCGFQAQLVDVVGRTEVEVEFPYRYDVFYLNSQSIDVYNSASGYWRMAIVPVSAAQGYTGTPPNIRFNIWMAAGDDFELAVPDLTHPNEITTITEGSIIKEGREEQGHNVPFFGENVMDLNELCRRPCYITGAAIDQPWAYQALPILGIPKNAINIGKVATNQSSLGNGTNMFSYTTYFAPMYMSVTGGMRYKIMYENLPTPESIWFGVDSQYYVGNGRADLLGVFLKAISNGGGTVFTDLNFKELEIPSRNKYLFTFARRYYTHNGTIDKVSDCLVSTSYTALATVSEKIFTSSADDFVLKGFLCCPLISY